MAAARIFCSRFLLRAHAETYHIHVQPHNCASPIATSAVVQLDSCITNFIIQEWFPYQSDSNFKLVIEDYEHQAKNGYMEVPEKPGLGIELNIKEVTKYKSTLID
jgi:L-alanine-DL-glutamate epimerase-like enolase superfamily enzyme